MRIGEVARGEDTWNCQVIDIRKMLLPCSPDIKRKMGKKNCERKRDEGRKKSYNIKQLEKRDFEPRNVSQAIATEYGVQEVASGFIFNPSVQSGLLVFRSTCTIHRLLPLPMRIIGVSGGGLRSSSWLVSMYYRPGRLHIDLEVGEVTAEGVAAGGEPSTERHAE